MDNKQCMLLLALASCFLLNFIAADPIFDDKFEDDEESGTTDDDLQVNSNARTNKSRCFRTNRYITIKMLMKHQHCTQINQKGERMKL